MSRDQQTVMLVNALRAYTSLIFHLKNKFRPETIRTSMDTANIGSICLVIRKENKADVSICGVKMLSLYRFLLDQIKLL